MARLAIVLALLGSLIGAASLLDADTPAAPRARLVLVPANVLPQARWLRALREMPLDPETLAVNSSLTAVVESAGIDEVLRSAGQAAGGPGNIRELSSVVERAVVLAEGGKIGPEELPLELREGADAVPARAFDLPPQGVEFEKVEEHLLRQAVERSGGVHTRGAGCSG